MKRSDHPDRPLVVEDNGNSAKQLATVVKHMQEQIRCFGEAYLIGAFPHDFRKATKLADAILKNG